MFIYPYSKRNAIMRRIILVLPALVFLLIGCLHSPQAIEEPSAYIEGFISLFEIYEEYCPYFAHKNIDWKELAALYYPMASQCETEEELIQVVTEMLAELQDPAVCLYISGGDVIYPYIKEYELNYNMDVLVEQYLEPGGWAGWEEGYTEGFGFCDPAVLPYVFMDTVPDFPFPYALDSLDAFVAQCIELDVPAVIIDIRMNPYAVSNHFCAHELMGRFTDHSRAGAIYRSRSGPEYYQYWDSRPAVFPAGPDQYTGTVILLVGENCINRSENMTANFMNFPNVVLVGDTTGGSVSNIGGSISITESWRCKFVDETILTYNKHWIEGAGIPPDIFVEATEADFASGVDPVLDYAIDMLEDYR